MKRLFSFVAKIYQEIRYCILDFLDIYFPRPVVIDEQGRRVIYGRTGAIYYLPDPNRPKGKWYVMLPDSDMHKLIVRWSWEYNPETGEEVCYMGYKEGPVPMDRRMSYSQYFEREPIYPEPVTPDPDAIRVLPFDT